MKAKATINRIMIAGTNSGCGKTTVTCALLKALLNRNLKVASFKCGPDYIDPMFHSEILGSKSSNLDFHLCGENTPYLFAENSKGRDISVVEGVMGFYDGISGDSPDFSSCNISNRLGIPVVLVVNAKGAFLSVVAMIKGYLDLYPNHIQAVILNRVSKAMYPSYKEMIEKHIDIKVLGYLPYHKETVIESRHLGLVTAAEIHHLQERTALLGKMAAECIDLDSLLKLAADTEPLEFEEVMIQPIAQAKLAVAKDKAFCFYYEDSLVILEKLGAQMVPFSPLEDEAIPDDVDGIFLGGGYPELYLEQLAQNETMKASIRAAHKKGMPIYAECGGYMYLGESIDNQNMVGLIPMKASMTNRLQNFGYVTLKAKEDTILLKKTEEIAAHEFHYSVSTNEKHALLASKRNGKSWEAGYAEDHLLALYPHLHFWGNKKIAMHLMNELSSFHDKRELQELK